MKSVLQNYQFFLCASKKQKELHADFIHEIHDHCKLKMIEEVNNDPTSIILILGGDGSLNYFLNNFLSTNNQGVCNVIYFPLGTANDFSKSIPIMESVPTRHKVESILARNTPIRIPIVKCNDRLFINAASAGSPATITDSGENILKKATGKVSYYISAIEKMFNPTYYSILYSLDSGEWEKLEACGFLVSQGLYAGGGIKISTSSSANFGEYLNFVSPTEPHLTKSVNALLEIQKETLPQSTENLLSKFSKTLKIKCEKTIPLKLDGEYYETSELEFKKTDNYLNIFLH